MVSKSANYCQTSRNNNTGLMLLCEVALGDTWDLNAAKFVTELPIDKNSVKGVGQTYPNPQGMFTRSDGVIIPSGTPVTDQGINSTLLYNEYIVYDAAQVKCQYLFRMKFNYKY